MACYTAEYKRLSCEIRKEISDDINKISRETRQYKTAIVEDALKMYIKHYNENKENNK